MACVVQVSQENWWTFFPGFFLQKNWVKSLPTSNNMDGYDDDAEVEKKMRNEGDDDDQ